MILLTGCAGFIGSNVAHQLISEGISFVGLDNLNDAYDVRLKEWRMSKLKESADFPFYQLDLNDNLGIKELFETYSFEAVINLAAWAGVPQSLDNPSVYLETNTNGTLSLLELCKDFDVAKFVLASTSSIYGQAQEQPLNEKLPTDRPLSPYTATKKAAELLCHSYHHIYEIDVTVLRYFTVYGPAGRPDMSIFRFIRWITEGEKLKLNGDGSQSRDFTFVDDIARGTVRALRPVGYEIINLGGDRSVTINQVIRQIETLVNEKAIIENHPFHPADVRATWADISKANELLDWKPETTLEEGLKKSVDWYLENRQMAKELQLG
jgi:nucleoside-diphosphate-sugar epimerase